MNVLLNIGALGLVLLSFAAGGLALIFTLCDHRLAGGILITSGLIAVIAAPWVAGGFRLVGTRLPILRAGSPGPRTLTIVLWGVGLCVLGATTFVRV
jgi:hypothetical protein